MLRTSMGSEGAYRVPQWALLAMACILALVLAACGGEAEPVEDTAEPLADEPTDEPAEEQETEEQETESTESAEATSGEAAAFYEGNTVNFATGSSPGGGYDEYMRRLAPHLERELGAQVVVDNQPAGGGLLMLNRIATDSEQDGTELALFNGPGMAGAALAGVEGIAFDLAELGWVGKVSTEPLALIVAADSEYETIEDVINTPGFQFAVAGTADTGNISANVLIDALGLDASVATAFEGTSEVVVSLLAGDVDGMFNSLSSALELVENGETRPLLVLDSEPADPPFDVAQTQADLEPYYEEGGQELIQVHQDMSQLGRVLATHPDVPPERLQYLRGALERIMQDEEIIAEFEEARRPLVYVPGDELQEQFTNVMNAPPAFVEMVAGTIG